MIRYFLAVALIFLSIQSSYALDKTYIEIQLQKDNINLSASIKKAFNPLQSELRPKLSAAAVDYEYHAWGEKNESNEYALYKWELAADVNGSQTYELAKYWVKMSDSAVLKEILDDNKGRLLVGGLTHKNLRSGADIGNFLIFSKTAAPEKKAEIKRDVAPEAPEPPTKIQIKNAPVCEPVPGKPGFVFSPTTQKLIDVRGLAPGSLAKDPWSNKLIRIP